ncbi:hypothetical protein NL108_002883 [Boleophthalmus pectinirostris]|nr:hypothetical protein NL108_002883 [Boleophthalmus pectinirostris]
MLSAPSLRASPSFTFPHASRISRILSEYYTDDRRTYIRHAPMEALPTEALPRLPEWNLDFASFPKMSSFHTRSSFSWFQRVLYGKRSASMSPPSSTLSDQPMALPPCSNCTPLLSQPFFWGVRVV